MITLIVLTAAAFAAGVINSLAGGGSLVTFPALLFAGLNPIDANASSVVALMPGTFSGAWAYRDNILTVTEVSVTKFIAVSLVGGLLGALLLLWTPTAIFAGLVPWLTLFSTVVFAIGNFAPLELIRRLNVGPRGALLAHFVISLYGGYFGGGIGFLMLAALTAAGLLIRNAGATKNVLAAVMNASAVAIFAFSHEARWFQVAITCVGATAGGIMGGLMLNRVNEKLLRIFIISIGLILTVGLFLHAP